MRRSALLPVLFLLLLCAVLRAEKYDIDQYGATVNVPDGEGWFRRGGPTLRVGEFAVFALNSTTKGHFGVAVVPGYPTNDIRHGTVLARVMDTIRALGFEPSRQRFGTQNDQPYVEVIGGLKALTGENYVMVARGILRNGFLFITLQADKGADEDADRAEFMAHIESLRFETAATLERPQIEAQIPQLVPWFYRTYRVAALAASVLVPGFFVMLFITRHRRSR